MRLLSAILGVFFLFLLSGPASALDIKGNVLLSDGSFIYETVTVGQTYRDSHFSYYEGSMPGYNGQLLYDPYNRMWVAGPIKYRLANMTFAGQQTQGWIRTFGDGSEDARFFFGQNGHAYQRVDVYGQPNESAYGQGRWLPTSGTGSQYASDERERLYSFWVDLAEQRDGDIVYLRNGENRPSQNALEVESRSLWSYDYGYWRDGAPVRPRNNAPMILEERLSTGLEISQRGPAAGFKGFVLLPDGTFRNESVELGQSYKDSYLNYYEGSIPGYSGKFLYDPYNRMWVSGPVNYKSSNLTFNGKKQQGWVREFANGARDSKFFFGQNGHVYQLVDFYRSNTSNYDANGRLVNAEGTDPRFFQNRDRLFSYWVDLVDKTTGELVYLKPGATKPRQKDLEYVSRDLWTYDYGSWRNGALVRPIDYVPGTGNQQPIQENVTPSVSYYKGNVLLSDGTLKYDTVTLGNTHKDSYLNYYEGSIPGNSGKLLYDPYNRMWVSGPVNYKSSNLTFNGKKQQGWVREFANGARDSKFFFGQNGHVYQLVDFYRSSYSEYDANGRLVNADGIDPRLFQDQDRLFSYWVDLVDKTTGELVYLKTGATKPRKIDLENVSSNLWSYDYGNWRNGALVRPIDYVPGARNQQPINNYGASSVNFKGNVLLSDGTLKYDTVTLGNTHKDSYLSYYEGSIPGYTGQLLYDPYNRMWVSGPINYKSTYLMFNGERQQGWVREFANGAPDSRFFFGQNGHVYQRVDFYRSNYSEYDANGQLVNAEGIDPRIFQDQDRLYSYWVDLADRTTSELVYLKTGVTRPTQSDLVNSSRNLWSYDYGNWRNGAVVRPSDYVPAARNEQLTREIITPAVNFRGNVLLSNGTLKYDTITLGKAYKDSYLNYYEGSIPGYTGQLLYDPYNRIWVQGPVDYRAASLTFNGVKQNGWVRQFGSGIEDSQFFFGENGHVYQRVDKYKTSKNTTNKILDWLVSGTSNNQSASENQERVYSYWVDLADRTNGDLVYLKEGVNRPSASDIASGSSNLWGYEYGNWRSGILVRPIDFEPIVEKEDALTSGLELLLKLLN